MKKVGVMVFMITAIILIGIDAKKDMHGHTKAFPKISESLDIMESDC